MSVLTVAFAILGFWFVVLVLIAVVFMAAGGFPRIPGRLGNHSASYWMFYASVIGVAGWVAYLWDVTRNPRVPREKRALWAVVLFFVGPWSLPFYFWFYIRQGTTAPPPASHASRGPNPAAPRGPS
jgi:hypothetical protein